MLSTLFKKKKKILKNFKNIYIYIEYNNNNNHINSNNNWTILKYNKPTQKIWIIVIIKLSNNNYHF